MQQHSCCKRKGLCLTGLREVRPLQSGHTLPWGYRGMVRWVRPVAGREEERWTSGRTEQEWAGRGQPLRGRETARAEWERGVRGGGLCRRGRAESEPWGAGRGRERTQRSGESRGGSGGIHGNKSGLREIRLPESEFVCNNNTNYSLSLRSLGHVGGRNWESEWEKLGVLGEGWINLLSCESGVGVRGAGEGTG